jgi:hypothetical protein
MIESLSGTGGAFFFLSQIAMLAALISIKALQGLGLSALNVDNRGSRIKLPFHN